MTAATQWHVNAYTAITMLNTKSMTVAFKQWCDSNGLTAILRRFLDQDGDTLKPQYVTTDNGLEHDHNAIMSLHKWHIEDNDVVMNNRAVRLTTDNGMQWHNVPVTIMNSQITMHVDRHN
eukprot:2693917-Amphidinium_carterae.1